MNRIHFIHIPKNGGMTIRRAPMLKHRITTSTPGHHISPEYTQQLLATMNKYGEHHGYQHARWRDLKPSTRKGKCFAIVRNPWSKVVSRYTFMMLALTPGTPGYNRTNANPTYSEKSFEEFLEERHIWGGKEFFWHRAIKGWFPQIDHVVDENGKLHADIMRLEKLNEDVTKYFRLGKIKLDTRNVSNREKKDYRSFYNDTTKKIVEDWYAEDIEFFGFTFDGMATKNIWSKS